MWDYLPSMYQFVTSGSSFSIFAMSIIGSSFMMYLVTRWTEFLMLLVASVLYVLPFMF